MKPLRYYFKNLAIIKKTHAVRNNYAIIKKIK